MSGIRLKEVAAATIPTPAANTVTLFCNSADGVPSFKDDAGVVTPITTADPELLALAGLTSAADKLPYFTGSGTAALADFTAAGRALLDDANAAAQLTTLGAQPLDAELTAIAGLTSAADKGIQFTGAGTAATFDLTAAGKALLDDAAASNQRTTLGLGNSATLNVGTTAGTVAAGDDSRFASGSGGGTPGTSTPYMYPFSEAISDALNDNFQLGDGAGGMDTAGTRFSGASAWTAENISSAGVIASGRLWLTSPADTLFQVRGYYQTLPVGNWCYRMHLTAREMITRTTQYYVGMYLRESATGKIEVWGVGQAAGTAVAGLASYKMTDYDTFSATRLAHNLNTTIFPTFIEIEYDGTSYHLRAGYADQALQRFSNTYIVAKANFFTTAGDGIGVFSSNNQSVAATLISRGFYRVPVSNVF
jgi:hypothetical protein